MNDYSDLFEKIDEQRTPEQELAGKIEHEIRELLTTLKGDYWFHEDAIYSEYDVINWLKENKPEFYKRALEQPETIEGSDHLTAALEALGLMKNWFDVDEKDIQTPEEEEHWKGALGKHD